MSNQEPASMLATIKDQGEWTREKIDLLKRTIMPSKTSDDELELFLHFVKRSGLDPFAGQVYGVKRWDSAKQCEVLRIQTGIDGFRLTAQRTHEYEGSLGPWWCGEDGKWKDVWLDKAPPKAARVGVWRKGFREPAWAVARWDDYAVRKKDGSLTPFWVKMAPLMLGKCAEALALRKAFPMELSGIYTDDEMAQAETREANKAKQPADPMPEPQDDIPVDPPPPQLPASTPAPAAPATPAPAEPTEEQERQILEALRTKALCAGWRHMEAPFEPGKCWKESTKAQLMEYLRATGAGKKAPAQWTVDEVRAFKSLSVNAAVQDAEVVPPPTTPPAPPDNTPKPAASAFADKHWYTRPVGFGSRPGLTWEQAATQNPAELAKRVKEAKRSKGRPTKEDSRGWTDDEMRCLVALNQFNNGYLVGGANASNPLPASTSGGDDAGSDVGMH